MVASIPTSRLSYANWPDDPATWAREVGSSERAAALLGRSVFIDLHNDMEVPVRLLGWDPAKHHGISQVPLPFFGHTDWPRLRQAGVRAVAYDLATNVFRSEAGRQAITVTNVDRIRQVAARHPDDALGHLPGPQRRQPEGQVTKFVSR